MSLNCSPACKKPPEDDWEAQAFQEADDILLSDGAGDLPDQVCDDCAVLAEPQVQPADVALALAAASGDREDVPVSKKGWEFLEKHGWPKFWAAPMVRGSELTWRMQVRKHGVQIATSPMIVAAGYARSAYYRSMFQFMPPGEGSDRPLVIQIAGTNPQVMLEAARLLEPLCDAIEVNMGCPKGCAQKQGFGAYLMSRPDLCVSIIKLLAENLRVPLFVKTRIFSTWEQTAEFTLALQGAGAALLTVHGRTKEQDRSGNADWEVVGRIVKLLRIPVVCNGDIRSKQQAEECLALTGSPAVMIGRGLLANPAMFNEQEYLQPRREIQRRFEAGFQAFEEQYQQQRQQSESGSPQETEPEGGVPPPLPSRVVWFHHMEQCLSDFEWRFSLKLTREYLEMCQECPPHKSYISQHLHAVLGRRLKLYPQQFNRLMVFDRMPKDKLRIQIYGKSCQWAEAAGNGVGFEEDLELIESSQSVPAEDQEGKPAADSKPCGRPRPSPTPMDATPRELRVLMELLEQLEAMPSPERPTPYGAWRVAGSGENPEPQEQQAGQNQEHKGQGQQLSPRQQQQQGEVQVICKYFVRGYCRDGDGCTMIHTQELDVGDFSRTMAENQE